MRAWEAAIAQPGALQLAAASAGSGLTGSALATWLLGQSLAAPWRPEAFCPAAEDCGCGWWLAGGICIGLALGPLIDLLAVGRLAWSRCLLRVRSFLEPGPPARAEISRPSWLPHGH